MDAASESSDFKYWAFISYAHEDEAWARWIQHALEKYSVPRRLIGRRAPIGEIPSRIAPVFRDTDASAGERELKPQILGALSQSRSQIVICSRSAARSRWLSEQIAHFKALGREEQIFALVVDGEPHAAERNQLARECLPEALRYQFNPTGTLTHMPAQPIVADARLAADGKDNAKLKLIAGMLGVEFDELKRPELQARSRRMALLASLAMGVTGVAIVMAIQAYEERNAALKRQRQAEELIQFMVTDLGGKLEPMGKLSALDTAGQKAIDYFAALDPDSQTDAALNSQTQALRQIGDVRLRQGNYAGAERAYEEALAGERALLSRYPASVERMQSVAEAQQALSSVNQASGDQDQAMAWLERSAETVSELVKLEPANPKWLTMSADINIQLGRGGFERQEYDKARSFFHAAIDAQKVLAEQSGKAAATVTLAQLHGWLSAVEAAQKHWQPSVDAAVQEANLWRTLSHASPDDAMPREKLVAALLTQVDGTAQMQSVPASDPVLAEALRQARALTEQAPENAVYLGQYRACLERLEQTYIGENQLDLALQTDHQLLPLARKLFGKSSERGDALDALLAAYVQSAELAQLRYEETRAAALLTEALTLPLSEQQRRTVAPERWLKLNLLAWSSKSRLRDKDEHASAASEWLRQIQATRPAATPELMMRYAVATGKPDEARRWSAQLSAAELGRPALRQFCAKNPVCDVKSAPAVVPHAEPLPASVRPH